MQFSELIPEVIFQAIFSQGFRPTGVLYPLNSYENRVYEIHVEDHLPLIVKFYRPGRWTKQAIIEEHAFIDACQEVEVPVVSPLPLKNSISSCSTLGKIDDILYAFYPKFRGKEHDETTNEDRRWLGRTLGRLHNVGEHFKTKHRLTLNSQTYGTNSLQFILTQAFLPEDLKKNLETLLLNAIKLTEPFFTRDLKAITLHGDCHPGNVLWNRDGPFLVDFDDMVVAPVVQDVWMLLYGDREEKQKQLDSFLEGYEVFRKFNHAELRLTEPLRTLRIIRHAAWIGQRYAEPIFKKAFPYYQERRYWENFMQEIREQIALMQEII